MNLEKIYNENCLITMGNMPDDYVDVVITSPPYDEIRNYNGYQFEFEEIAYALVFCDTLDFLIYMLIDYPKSP